MHSPTYGRIMNLAQAANDAIRQVRSSITVQVPFLYVHTLATLVHLNNLLCAISFGFTLGSSGGALLMHAGYRVYPRDISGVSKEPELRPVEKEVQIILMGLMTCFVAPLLYQAFLEIGLSLSAPFNSDDGLPSPQAGSPGWRLHGSKDPALAGAALQAE